MRGRISPEPASRRPGPPPLQVNRPTGRPDCLDDNQNEQDYQRLLQAVSAGRVLASMEQ